MTATAIRAEREQAAALRERGMGYREIAAELGVGTSTVYAWLNPSYAEQQRAASRAAKRRRQTTCPRCGQLVSYERPGEICAGCRYEARYGERNRRIFEAWELGEPTKTIASREGITETAVLSLVDLWRAPLGLSLRRRVHREAWDHIARRWNDDGWTAAQIACELETSEQNVAMMITSMRRVGIDVVHRNGSNVKETVARAGSMTVRELAEAAGISLVAATNRLVRAYARGELERVREGRAYRYRVRNGAAAS